MKYFLYASLLLPRRLLAQAPGSPTPRATPARDTAAWTLSLEANQRTFYLGREYGHKAFSLAPSLTYTHHSGLYGTVAGYYFQQSEPPRYAFTDLELGYANTVADKWTYSLSYDHVFFTPPLTATDKLLPRACYALMPNLGAWLTPAM